MQFQFNDGGRAAAGYRGTSGDCVTRAIAIVTGVPYTQVYNELFRRAKEYSTRRGRVAKMLRRNPSPRDGTARAVFDPYIRELGYRWVPTMFIGSGCRVHMDEKELPSGRLIVRLGHHLTAVLDGVVHDTQDCSRERYEEGYNNNQPYKRCVYGYYVKL